MKLWVDVETPPPDGSWEWVTTSEAAVATMKFFRDGMDRREPLEKVSFACSLGGDDNSGRIIRWMIRNRFRFREYQIHSGTRNQVEWMRQRILMYLI